MGMDIDIAAYAGRESEEFCKHYKAVKFCIENDLSYPKETSDFFKGKIEGDDLEDIDNDSVLEMIENGVRVDIPRKYEESGIVIKVKDIPKECDRIVISFF